MLAGYHSSRLEHDPRRDILWKALWRYHFKKIVPAQGCVVDLGCGYGEFINNVEARRRVGVDMWDGISRHLAEGVEAIVSSVTDLDRLEDGSVDFAFASNLFEHVTQADFAAVLKALRAKLAPGGTLNILQPNYRYAYREYFDDYTHISIYSHVSLADFLAANDYEVIDLRPRFLPLTVKSKLPVWPSLIGLYLNSPIKPLAKQMFVRARPVDQGTQQ
ncbi:MAG: class I SAM-dependent methyltransferase [Sphingomicrobium sp.]